jgi:PAS domain S-box-containing protein
MNFKPRIHYFLIMLTISVGIALSISAFITSRNWDYRKIYDDFRDKAEHRYISLRMAMELNLHTLESLKALYVSNQMVTRVTFRDFVQQLSLDHPDIQAFEWIPRMSDTDRPLYEQQARKEGFPLFHITERNAHGDLIRAARRSEYFPVYFAEPLKDNESAIGFDLASDPARRIALESARDTGNMVAFQKVELVQEKAGQYGFLVFVPLYQRGVPLNTPETRREHLRGFILGVFRVRDIVEKSLTGTQPAGINYALYDMSAPEGARWLYSHQSRLSKKGVTPGIETNPGSNELFQYTKTLNVAGREWMVVFTATPDFFASRRSWGPWGILFIGLLLTGLVAGFLLTNLRNMQALSDMNTQLLGEIEKGKRTQDALKVSQESYQTFIDATDDMVFLKDEQFRYIIVNKSYLKYLGKKEDDIIGKTGFDFRPPEIAELCNRSDINTLELDAINVTEETAEDRIIETTKFPVTLGKDKTGIGCFMRDITEKRLTEKKLLESEQKYRNIFENTMEGIFQTTSEGHFLSANPSLARMFGYDSPEELMATISDLSRDLYVNRDDRERFQERIEQDGKVEGFEVEVFRKDRSKIWVLYKARAVCDKNGKLICYEGTVEDVTSRKLAAEELLQTTEKLRKSLAGTIEAMSMTVEARDPFTAGHQRRVSNLARVIAQEMRLSPDIIDNIRMAGILHDIGKISVPAEILSKPGILTDIEMSLIGIHSQSGYDILKGVELPCPIAKIVLQHHERLDGSGYPQGLKGDQILIETRIISVADVVEAIASHRPYRPARGIDAALEEIEKNKGTLYDEKVVDVCLKLFREKGFTF